jgi:uncharacterized protein YebE (UPF0316 family)
MINLNYFFTDNEFIDLIALPCIIFGAKILEVSLATVGLIFISRGYKKLATLISFIEIFIYLFAISRLIENLTNIWYYVSYAGGYALGTYAGIWLEEKLSIGYANIIMLTKKNPDKLIKAINMEGFIITNIEAYSSDKKVQVLNTIVRRKDINRVIDMLNDFDKRAFYSIEDIRSVNKKAIPA